MTSAQVVKTSVNVISNSPSQDYTHPDDRTLLNDMTPGFKPFTIIHSLRPPGSETEVKLSQFADDTTLLLTDDQCIDEAFRTFELYERASGARINQNKCKGLWSGTFSRRTDQLHGFEWFNDYIPEKIIGPI